MNEDIVLLLLLPPLSYYYCHHFIPSQEQLLLNFPWLRPSRSQVRVLSSKGEFE